MKILTINYYLSPTQHKPCIMNSRRYIDAQTRLTDLFLPELDRVGVPGVDINFNNTRQLDALLQFLELTLQTPDFVVVPSVNVLHILVTLSCRCPTSNWTHKSAQLEGIGASTEYMKQVNSDYNHTLYNMLILARCGAILRHYVDISTQNSHNSLSLQQLFSNLEKVLLKLVPYSLMGSFLKLAHKAASKNDPSKNEPEIEHFLPETLPKRAVVEVISDSEESDSIIEVMEPTELATRYRRFQIPPKSVTSLSDLGSKTSGLGETTLLFKNIPHLLANATPEPEETARAKRPKTAVNPLDQIQVYDDYLLAKKLSSVERFDIWNLLRWALDCADLSSQYQKFLFNSSNTNLHWIYRTYEEFFSVFFDFVAVQFSMRKQPKGSKVNLITSLLLLLGPKRDWCERSIETVFAGLGITSNSRSQPCYDRERLLISHDPAVLVSRCKTTVDFTDNLHSMDLRCQILGLLFDFMCGQDEEDKFVEVLARKLAELDIQYMKAFFASYLKVSSSVKTSREVFDKLFCSLATKLVKLIADIETSGWDSEQSVQQSVNAVTNMLRNRKLYANVCDDLSYKSFAEFEDKWTKVLFLVEWQVTRVLLQVQQCDISHRSELHAALLSGAKAADSNRQQAYREFLETRSEDADVQAEDLNFTLGVAEVENYKRQSQGNLQAMALLFQN